jgi:hypothetical protein
VTFLRAQCGVQALLWGFSDVEDPCPELFHLARESCFCWACFFAAASVLVGAYSIGVPSFFRYKSG